MMNTNPIISIIIPIYKSEKYLALCIESILSQTYKDFELLLINDGSPDNCGKICNEYASFNTKVRVFHFDNSGALNARIKGIEKANGKYICFVDSDDTLPKDSLSLLIETTYVYDLDITMGVWNWVSIKYPKRIIPLGTNGILNPLEFTRALLNEEIYSGPVGRLYKKSLFTNGLLDSPFRLTNNEDLIMNIKLGANSFKIGVFNDIIVYNYFERPQSASKKKLDLSYWIMFYKYLTKVLEDIKYSDDLMKELIRFKLRGIFYKVAQKDVVLDYSDTELNKIIDEASMNRITLSERIMVYALTKEHFFSFFNFLYKCTMVPLKMWKLSSIISKRKIVR